MPKQKHFREFYEFHSRLCTLYPLSKFHSLPKGLSIGRSEVREVNFDDLPLITLHHIFVKVAEKRKREIGAFLLCLFRLSDEISHSDLVYTFFHPLHRDQKEANIHINKLKGREIMSCRAALSLQCITEPSGHQRKPSAGRICGKIKLSISYKVDTLHVLVHHIENLSCSDPASVAYTRYWWTDLN